MNCPNCGFDVSSSFGHKFREWSDGKPGKAAPPSVPGDTSEGAADDIADNAANLRMRVFLYIEAKGGATCDEVEQSLGMKHQTASPRIRELCLDGRIRDSGERRETRSGSSARIYIVEDRVQTS